MKISKIEVKEFRLLKNVSIDLENVLSLVIGKNNTGKTSFLSILDKFLNEESFSFDDFNLSFQKKLKDYTTAEVTKENFEVQQISLKLHISYDDSDNLENISRLILDLNPIIKKIILSFEYLLDYSNYKRLLSDFKTYSERIPEKDILYFLNKNHKNYFKVHIKSLEVDNEENFKEIEYADIRKIINLQIIDAKRDVSNTETKSSKTLSSLSSKYYKAKSSKNKDDATQVTELQKTLIKTDEELSKTYETFFKPVVSSVKTFSSISHEKVLEIISTLQERNLLEQNTTVKYNQDGHNLPENFNGLGYMNLFAIIFDIHIKLDEFKKENSETSKPADINLLFIEEPEAHTHPQMQYVFIKNIKRMLKNETQGRINLQTIISTHSSHIVSQSEFDDIKYFSFKSTDEIKIQNLSSLEEQYLGLSSDEMEITDEIEKEKLAKAKKLNYDFLKKYLTLNNSELLFAEKAIFIEGDAERILFPSIMKQIDKENEADTAYTPLLSQCISIVEVGGNHSHIFDNLITFLGIKTLIVTDLDPRNTSNTKCSFSDGGVKTGSSSIKYFLNKSDLNELVSLEANSKILLKENSQYKPDAAGKVMIAFQVKENNYNASSFEDAILSINMPFFISNKNEFSSLKYIDEWVDASTNYYDLANRCIGKKTTFATDILYSSGDTFVAVPLYIKEGLKWLAQK